MRAQPPPTTTERIRPGSTREARRPPASPPIRLPGTMLATSVQSTCEENARNSADDIPIATERNCLMAFSRLNGNVEKVVAVDPSSAPTETPVSETLASVAEWVAHGRQGGCDPQSAA